MNCVWVGEGAKEWHYFESSGIFKSDIILSLLTSQESISPTNFEIKICSRFLGHFSVKREVMTVVTKGCRKWDRIADRMFCQLASAVQCFILFTFILLEFKISRRKIFMIVLPIKRKRQHSFGYRNTWYVDTLLFLFLFAEHSWKMR